MFIKLPFPLEVDIMKESTKEHGDYIAVTFLNKISEEKCLKHNIFFKSVSFESIFLSTRRKNVSSSDVLFRSPSIASDKTDEDRCPGQDPEAHHLPQI